MLKRFGPSNEGNSRQQFKVIDVIPLKERIKMAQTNDVPVLLGVCNPQILMMFPKTKMKTKTNSCASAIHGMTKGEKHRILKE